jgi:hypothetical protein
MSNLWQDKTKNLLALKVGQGERDIKKVINAMIKERNILTNNSTGFFFIG